MGVAGVCVLFAACVAVATAQIPSLGFCPEYTPMEDFDMNRFLGKWYEAERYFTFTEVGARCVVTDYAKAASGRIYISNEYTSRLTGVKRVVTGSILQTSREGVGKFQVKYATTPLATETTLVVLNTDYDNYAVVWSCNGLGILHAENAWVLTRERLPPGPTLQKAYGTLDKFRINHTFLVKTQQEGCAIAASDINAAQGITSFSTIADQTGEEQKTPIKKKPAVKPEEIDETIPDAMKEAHKADAEEADNAEQALDPIEENEDDEKIKAKNVGENVVKSE